MLYTNRVKSPYSYMPWSNYEVKRRKRENRNVNVIEKNGAEKLLQTSSILTTILLYLVQNNAATFKKAVTLAVLLLLEVTFTLRVKVAFRSTSRSKVGDKSTFKSAPRSTPRSLY